MRALAITEGAGELYRYRELLLSLTWRDVRIRYKQSMLGIGWAVLMPLSMMLVFTFVFTRAIDARSVLKVDMPYALFAYTGLVPWTFFSAGLNGCVNSLVANRNLVTKVYFPREVFPLACIGSSFVDFSIASTVLAGLMAYFHFSGAFSCAVHPTLMLVPIVLCVQVAMMIGLGMLLAMANLFYRDVRQVFSVVIQLWMFVSAVVVPVPNDGSVLAKVIALNPLVSIINAYRDCILYGRIPDAGGFCYAAIMAAIFLVVGWVCFRRASFKFAECI